VIIQILLLDMVFSLDSVITAVGMVDELYIMIAAVVLAIVLMILTAGWISGFVNRQPIVAGPILLILYVEHGSEFAAEAASAGTLAIVPLALFALIFAHLTRRHGWLLTLMIGWVVVLLADLALAQIRLPAVIALLLALIALHGASAVLRRLDQPPSPSIATPWWDLPARAVATALLVVVVTGLAAALGPGLTGALTPFPISFECGLRLHHSAGRTRWGFGTAARSRAGP
jgi:Integral membrane protein TerC family